VYHFHSSNRTIRKRLLPEITLTPTSYIVLGLLERVGQATPYDLKQQIALTIGNFWSVPHSQLYAEPARLARSGLLHEERERGGRRRKVYSLTDTGRAALTAWRDEPTAELPELRDLGLLKLFFEGDPARLATRQREAHEEKLATYEGLLATDDGKEPRGPWRTLRAGVEHERVWVDYWRALEGG
jgi:DNA-binding PadR family transcriptional regulator